MPAAPVVPAVNPAPAVTPARVVAKVSSDQAKPNGNLWIVPGQEVRTAAGPAFTADGKLVRVSGKDAAGWIGCGGWRVHLPEDAIFEYPVSPFNPYAKDGKAPLAEAVGVVRAGLGDGARQRVFRVTVG